jgi:tetratricopeptide (TPR) repeat protein
MKREPPSAASLAPPAEQVEFALARIEHSAAFRGSPRHRKLLCHLVRRVLANDLAALKESVIAVEAFGRPAASFDPKLDTIVRVEARRLRTRLAGYYRAEGRDAPLRIELPVGSYIPRIVMPVAAGEMADVTRRARDLTERGEHYLRQALSREALEAALSRFDAALRESPAYAPAYVGMGRAWLNLATGWYHHPAAASEHAAEALRRALELEPGDAIAHALLAAIQHRFEADWPGARRGFERAIKLAPQQAFVHSAYGCHLVIEGWADAAERELLSARRLDPQYLNTRVHMVNLRIAQRRFADATAELLALRDIAPATMPITATQGAIAMFQRDAEAAVAAYTQACEAMPDHGGCFIALAGAHALAGRFEKADAIHADALARFDARLLSPFVLAIFETRRGRPDRAYALLERAQDECDPSAVQIAIDPSFQDLHADPRWPLLLRRRRALRRRRVAKTGAVSTPDPGGMSPPGHP